MAVEIWSSEASPLSSEPSILLPRFRSPINLGRGLAASLIGVFCGDVELCLDESLVELDTLDVARLVILVGRGNLVDWSNLFGDWSKILAEDLVRPCRSLAGASLGLSGLLL